MSQTAAATIEQMVKQQVRAWNVVDERVLNALRQTPRSAFVPAPLRAVALADTGLALGNGQEMLAPKVEGKILQALNLAATDQALVIGAGNAHLAAALARLVARVTLLDSDAALLETARQNVLALGLNNVLVQTGTLADIAAASYEVIVLTAALPTMVDTLRQGLKPEGRLFAVVGAAPAMEAVLITRRGSDSFEQTTLFETVLPILADAQRPAPFRF